MWPAAVDPAPAPTGPDPFGPIDVSIFPEPPPWVIPTFIGLMIAAMLVVAFLLVQWNRRAHADKLATRERYRQQKWVDLSDFDPKKDSRRPRSPKVLRDEIEQAGDDADDS